MPMQLLALVVLASAPSVVSAASCSGLSTGAMVAIIVESVVIFLLVILLLGILRQLQIARNKLKATRLHVEEYKRDAKSDGLAERRHSTTSLVQSPHDEESHVALLPPSLRPQSHSFSSPPSVRSSTLYDFTPRQEEVGFDFKSYRPTTYVEPPAHIPEVSVTTLPNPHSEHGHGSEHEHDEEHSTTHESFLETPLPLPTHSKQPSDDSEATQTPRPGSRAVSESSWAADVVGALERGPTPISRSTTATTTLSSYSDGTTPIATGPVHDLLLNRQRDSGSHSVPGIN